MRRGFTLVELMVSVALVALMMLMFAQVFQLAAGSVSQQKGMAELDQRERMLVSILRGDLEQRSMQDVGVFPSGASAPPPPVYDMGGNEIPSPYSHQYRRGYFSISENSPDDPTDDVLQFTILQQPTLSAKIELPFAGRATLLKFDTDDPADYDSQAERNAALAAAGNQPELDDGIALVNGIGTSRAAEVSYFLRNGVLYRRVLLVRERFDDAATDPQPVHLAPAHYSSDYVGNVDQGTGNFWQDFDYSVYHEGNSGLRFHSILEGFDNSAPATSTVQISGGTVPKSLGVPHMRFGAAIYDNDGNFLDGQPRETVSDGSWIGRYTMQETSHSGFIYPGDGPRPDGSGPDSPMDPATATTLNSDGLVTEYADEFNRRGDDILLTNVHEFDIKVWDGYANDSNSNGTIEDGERMAAFLDLGHSETTAAGDAGHYHDSRRVNRPFGNRFDTWNANMPADPPYQPTDPTKAAPENVWPYNEVPLQGIQIRVRYLDVKSNQMRQVSLQYSFKREF